MGAPRTAARAVCVANLHASAGLPEQARARWSRPARRRRGRGDDPLVLGGDFNLRPALQPEPFATLRERFGLAEPTAPRAIDHLLVRGLERSSGPGGWPRGARGDDPSGLRIRLSDHAPVVAEFVR